MEGGHSVVVGAIDISNERVTFAMRLHDEQGTCLAVD